MNGRELTAEEFRYRAALDLCRRAVAADDDADPTVAGGHLAELARLLNAAGDAKRQWAVRWPASIHDTEAIEPCDDQVHAARIARDYSSEECVGEVVSRTVTYGPWETDNGGAA